MENRISYLLDKKNNYGTWKSITRDERFFCCELYHEISNNPKKFIDWLILKINAHSQKIINHNEFWEVGFEVCFYRDFIFEIGEKSGNKSIKGSTFSQKRTFDLCLFSENYLIIIEAKAYDGFDTEQLESFKNDRKDLKKLLHSKVPEILLIGLKSSRYNPKKETHDFFDGMISWMDLAEIYPNDNFLRADSVKKNPKIQLSKQ
jgi:hypothetical protein